VCEFRDNKAESDVDLGSGGGSFILGAFGKDGPAPDKRMGIWVFAGFETLLPAFLVLTLRFFKILEDLTENGANDDDGGAGASFIWTSF